MCKRIISAGVFYIFFQILIFEVNSGVKGEKMAQNGNKVCLSYSISQETYIMWLWLSVPMCKMMIFPGFFSFFQNSDFLGFLKGGGGGGGKRAKNDP